MKLVLQDRLLFAKLEHPERGAPIDQRHARECLLPGFLYRIEIVDQQGKEKIIRKIRAESKRKLPAGDELRQIRVLIALKGVKYWWPEEMFRILDVEGRPFDLRLMQREAPHTKERYKMEAT